MNKLIFPQEIEVWYILPVVRKKFASGLVKSGLSQKNVAIMMGVTEAAISQYKKEKRAKEDFFNKELELELKKSVQKVIKNPKLLSREILHLNDLIKKSGILCKIYKEICIMNQCPDKNKSKECPYCKCQK